MKNIIIIAALLASTSTSAWVNQPTLNQTARSSSNFSGGYNYSDSVGRSTGSSRSNFSGGLNYFDSVGRPTGSSRKNFSGGYNYYDSIGRPVK